MVILAFVHGHLHQNDVEGMAHTVDPDQTAPIYGKCSKYLYSKILISKRKIPKISLGK